MQVADDFGYAGDDLDHDILDGLFADLIGCDEVVTALDELRHTVEFSKARGKSPSENISFNYLFLGSPGTGKTTVARRMGKMFMELGLLPTDEMKEVKASDLVTGYAGQAGMKTRQLLRDIRGGILFIDEAYQMDPARGGSYMTEAVDELVGALTKEEFKGKLLVILAGYDQDMEEMLKTNPGLKSRFSERIHFHDFDVEATVRLLLLRLEKKEIPLALADSCAAYELAQKLVESDGFGNGRDVVTWSDRVYREVATSSSHKEARNATANLKHLRKALDHILQSRIVRRDGQKCTSVEGLQAGSTITQGQDALAPPAVQQKVVVAEAMETCEDEEGPEPVAKSEPNLFESVDENVLKSLQAFLDQEGLNDAEGVQRLVKLDPNSAEFAQLVEKLHLDTGMSTDAARAQLIKWQSAHEELQRKMEQLKTQSLGARALWRCAVCGRANKPWIACYVAPYICGYEKVTVSSY